VAASPKRDVATTLNFNVSAERAAAHEWLVNDLGQGSPQDRYVWKNSAQMGETNR
jgi:hypothetical protein